MTEEAPRQQTLEEVRRALEGRYRVHRELGRGGMGIVLAAEQIALERPVALKLFNNHYFLVNLPHHGNPARREWGPFAK